MRLPDLLGVGDGVPAGADRGLAHHDVLARTNQPGDPVGHGPGLGLAHPVGGHVERRRPVGLGDAHRHGARGHVDHRGDDRQPEPAVDEHPVALAERLGGPLLGAEHVGAVAVHDDVVAGGEEGDDRGDEGGAAGRAGRVERPKHDTLQLQRAPLTEHTMSVRIIIMVRSFGLWAANGKIVFR